MAWFKRDRAAKQPADDDFSFDGAPEPRTTTCSTCGEAHDGVTGFVLNHGDAYAIYYADSYPHSQETYLEVVLGSFTEPDYLDNATFGCRYGYVDGQDLAAASLSGPIREARPIFGQILDRDAALRHDRLEDFWALTDWLVLNDELLHRTVYHLPPKPNADPSEPL